MQREGFSVYVCGVLQVMCRHTGHTLSTRLMTNFSGQLVSWTLLKAQQLDGNSYGCVQYCEWTPLKHTEYTLLTLVVMATELRTAAGE